jgi:hypothetical protein
VSGNYAYLANADDGLRVYDIGDPTNVVNVGHIDNGGRANGVAVSGNYAYLANANDGLRVYEMVPDAVLTLGLTVSNTVSAAAFVGDGSGLTNVPGDNLGNHTATQNIQLNGHYLSGDGNNEGVFVDAGGRVGIGNTSPSHSLDVTGEARLLQGTKDVVFTSGNFGPANLESTDLFFNKDNVGFNQSEFVLYNINNNTEGNRFFQLQYTADPEGLTIRKGGNVGIGTNAPQERLHVIGNILASGTVTGSSDRHVKKDFAPVDPQAVLAKVADLPITTWQYKADRDGERHVGPMAQDFYGAFHVGMDDKHISMVDADGVALAAIQGLNQKVESGKREAETEIRSLKAENTELKARLVKLEQLFNRKQDGGAK